MDLYFARSRVLERLNLLTKALPAGRRADARAGRHRGRARVLVHGRGEGLLAARPALAPGLVRPLPAQLRSRRRRGGERRRRGAPVPDRRRSQALARVPDPDLRGGGRRDAKQPQCRAATCRGERDLVGHPRPRAHREREGHRAGRHRRRRRRADLRPPGRRRQGRRRVPRGCARQGRRGGGGRRGGRALRREHDRRHRAASRRRSPRSRPGCRRVSGSSPSTTARRSSSGPSPRSSAP